MCSFVCSTLLLSACLIIFSAIQGEFAKPKVHEEPHAKSAGLSLIPRSENDISSLVLTVCKRCLEINMRFTLSYDHQTTEIVIIISILK